MNWMTSWISLIVVCIGDPSEYDTWYTLANGNREQKYMPYKPMARKPQEEGLVQLVVPWCRQRLGV